MKNLILFAAICAAAGSAYASVPIVEPSESDATPALILLALLGVVIASGSGMLSSRNSKNVMDITATDAEDAPDS